MKRRIILPVIAIFVILLLSLTGCSTNISFNVEDIDPNLRDDYIEGVNFSMINVFNSQEDIEKFFNNEYFGAYNADEFSQFDSDYFNKNSLFMICYIGHKNIEFTVNKMKRRGDEVFFYINAEKINIIDHYTYKFLTVEKSLIDGVTKYSYIIIS